MGVYEKEEGRNSCWETFLSRFEGSVEVKEKRSMRIEVKTSSGGRL